MLHLLHTLLVWVLAHTLERTPALAPLGDTWVGTIPIVRDYIPMLTDCTNGCQCHGDPCDTCYANRCTLCAVPDMGEYTVPPPMGYEWDDCCPPNAVPTLAQRAELAWHTWGTQAPVACTCGKAAPVQGSAVQVYTCGGCVRLGLHRTAYTPHRTLAPA